MYADVDVDDDSLEDGSLTDDADSDSLFHGSFAPVIRCMGPNGKRPVLVFKSIPRLLEADERAKVAIGKYRLTYKMVKTESKLVRSTLAYHGFREVHSNSTDFNVMWTGAHVKPYSLRSLNEYQMINHFPRSYEITRKDKVHGQSCFTPRSFVALIVLDSVRCIDCTPPPPPLPTPSRLP